jgi:CxC5 like cysteine cluster associated with KDZ transposases
VLLGWIKGLARAIKKSIDQNQRKPLKMKDVAKGMNEEEEITAFSSKLNSLAKILDLHPYNEHGQLEGKLQPVSHKLIQPVYILCPNSMECETANCSSRSLLQSTRTRDIPQVTLINDSVIYDDVFVFTGECPSCKTKYSADHERAPEAAESRQYNKVYLNSAKYLKVWPKCMGGSSIQSWCFE